METRERQTIKNFRELMDWISYCWDHPYELVRSDDCFILNKLYIERTRASYKLENFDLAPGVFEDVERFYELLYKEPSIIKE